MLGDAIEHERGADKSRRIGTPQPAGRAPPPAIRGHAPARRSAGGNGGQRALLFSARGSSAQGRAGRSGSSARPPDPAAAHASLLRRSSRAWTIANAAPTKALGGEGRALPRDPPRSEDRPSSRHPPPTGPEPPRRQASTRGPPLQRLHDTHPRQHRLTIEERQDHKQPSRAPAPATPTRRGPRAAISSAIRSNSIPEHRQKAILAIREQVIERPPRYPCTRGYMRHRRARIPRLPDRRHRRAQKPRTLHLSHLHTRSHLTAGGGVGRTLPEPRGRPPRPRFAGVRTRPRGGWGRRHRRRAALVRPPTRGP